MRLLLLVLVACSFSVFAEEELSAKAWLQSMSQTLKEKSYKMSIIQLQAEIVKPLIYVHGHVDGKNVAFLEYLNGPPKSAVRVDQTVTFIEHDQSPYSVHANHINSVWPAALIDKIESLEQSYQFVLGGRTRIAGRPGQLIRLIAKDNHRYDAQVWVDMSTYLPIRFDTVNRDKQLIDQTMVIELHELNEPVQILQQVLQQKWPMVINQAERLEGQNWQFTWLPVGVEIVVRDNHRLIGNLEPVEYIALSDGLTNISVYVAKAGEYPLPEELTSRNGIAMFVEKVGSSEVVVIGKVPVDTLERIAKSLVLK